jgi:hypothetical protein
MPNVQHRDPGEQEAVRDSDESVIEVGVAERPERDDREVGDPRDRAPQRGLAGVGYFAGDDGFF